MTPYLQYLKAKKLPEDRVEAWRIAAKAINYLALKATLYRRGKSNPWLRCVGLEEASKIIKEIHQGVYGVYEGATTLVNKIFRQGHYWPTMKKEAEDFVKKYNVC